MGPPFRYLFALPNEIVSHVFEFLPIKHVEAFFDYSPSVDRLINDRIFDHIRIGSAITNNVDEYSFTLSLSPDEFIELLMNDETIQPKSLEIKSGGLKFIADLTRNLSNRLAKIKYISFELSPQDIALAGQLIECLNKLESLGSLTAYYSPVEILDGFIAPKALKKLGLLYGNATHIDFAKYGDLESLKEIKLVGNSLLPSRILNIPKNVTSIILSTNAGSINRLTNFPSGLESLDLSNCNIFDVGTLDLAQFPHLKKLDLSSIPASSLGHNSLPPSLRKLILNETRIEVFDNFVFPPQLQSLRLSYGRRNGIIKFKNLVFPDTLTEIIIEDYRLFDLEYFNIPPNLQSLVLTSCNVDDFSKIKLPNGISELFCEDTKLIISGYNFPASLQRISMIGCKIRNLDGVTFGSEEMPSDLKYLSLNGNIIFDFSGFDAPDSLIELHLDHNEISTFTNNTFGCKLSTLSLFKNHLKEFPSELPDSIKVLQLSVNDFSLHSDIKLPSGLQHLYIQGTDASKIADVELPDSLESLDLENCLINSFKGIRFPTSLHTLYANENRLVSLDNVRFPSSLRHIDLYGNAISHLGRQVSLPSGLEVLLLRNNNIIDVDGTDFPSSLIILDLSCNYIRSIEIAGIPRTIKKVDLQYNPMDNYDEIKMQLFYEDLNQQYNL